MVYIKYKRARPIRGSGYVRRKNRHGNVVAYGLFSSIGKVFRGARRGVRSIGRLGRRAISRADRLAGRAQTLINKAAALDPTGKAAMASARIGALRQRGQAASNLSRIAGSGMRRRRRRVGARLPAGTRLTLRRRPMRAHGLRSTLRKVGGAFKRANNYVKRNKALSRTARALGTEFGSDNLRAFADVADLAGYGRSRVRRRIGATRARARSMSGGGFQRRPARRKNMITF